MTLAHDPRRALLVALDTPDLHEAQALVGQLRDLVGGFKIGLELCSAHGVPTVVEALAGAGGRLFLDLKLKDIPNTVAGAVRALSSRFGTKIDLLTLHTDGGSAMLRAAVAARGAATMRLIGVTVLTSIDAKTLNDELGIAAEPAEHALRLARLGQQSGIDGIVCSPHEAAAVRAALGPTALIITPGIRPTWAAAGDQRRVLGPAEALIAGADYLVIGRPITAPPAEVGDPASAARRILEEIATVRQGAAQ